MPIYDSFITYPDSGIIAFRQCQQPIADEKCIVFKGLESNSLSYIKSNNAISIPNLGTFVFFSENPECNLLFEDETADPFVEDKILLQKDKSIKLSIFKKYYLDDPFNFIYNGLIANCCSSFDFELSDGRTIRAAHVVYTNARDSKWCLLKKTHNEQFVQIELDGGEKLVEFLSGKYYSVFGSCLFVPWGTQSEHHTNIKNMLSKYQYDEFYNMVPTDPSSNDPVLLRIIDVDKIIKVNRLFNNK